MSLFCRIKISRTLCIVIVLWAIFAVGLGGLTYIHTDVRAYLIAVDLLYRPSSIYANNQTAYPPLFYAIVAILYLPIFLSGGNPNLSILTPLTVGSIKLVVIGAAALLCAVGLTQMESNDDQRFWVLMILFNPFLLLATVLLGQADSLVALGVLVGIIGWETDRISLASIGLAFATGIKIYPIVGFIPLLWHHKERWSEIVVGVLPVAIITGFIFLFQLPTAAYAFVDRSHPFGLQSVSPTPLSATYLPEVVLGITSIADAMFATSLLVAALWATWGQFRVEEVRLVVAMSPVIYIYAYNPSYRWLPFVVCTAYLGVRYSGEFGAAMRRYASGLSVLGVIPIGLAIGSRNLMGKPLLHTTIGTLSTNGPTVIGSLISAYRTEGLLVVLICHLALGLWAAYHSADHENQ